ncbi:MAG TPA: toll/interleukin-1 receptor domain-containing protein [Blastocatellia bacterium]|nr:toll/interleukin-1 receptor domain-containing protein [Blastocatellia bacterium]
MVTAEQFDYAYDIFISYSSFRKEEDGSQFDRKVAERLHRSLEAYRVPAALVKKGSQSRGLPRRLKKVFRDRDEVRAGASLDAELRDALEKSRFLVVICSPRSRNSIWVNQEIAIFRNLGREERILPILIEGEPAEVFPTELLKAEPRRGSAEPAPGLDRLLAQPLAADIRAKTEAESLRLLKHEKLRLIATVLDCSYDDLRRREHERFVRRAITTVAAMLALVAILAGLSIGLFLTQQREKRNAQLALDATGVIPLIAFPEENQKLDSAISRELRLVAAINNLETLRRDYPENVQCLEGLRHIYPSLGHILATQGRLEEAQAAYEKGDTLIVPVLKGRLRAWQPNTSPNLQGALLEPERKRWRDLLNIWEGPDDWVRAKHAIDYVDNVTEYLSVLDVSTAEGREEARRVLEHSLALFKKAKEHEALTAEQEELTGVILATRTRLSP